MNYITLLPITFEIEYWDYYISVTGILLQGHRQYAKFIRFGIQEANDPIYKSNGLLSEHLN